MGRKLVQPGELHPAEDDRDHVAHHQADDDGAHPQVGIGAAIQDDDDEQHQAGQAQVLEAGEAAVGARRRTAGHGGHAHLDQGQADQGDHDTGDRGCDDPAGVAQKPAEDHLDGRAQQADAEDHSQGSGGR